MAEKSEPSQKHRKRNESIFELIGLWVSWLYFHYLFAFSRLLFCFFLLLVGGRGLYLDGRRDPTPPHHGRASSSIQLRCRHWWAMSLLDRGR